VEKFDSSYLLSLEVVDPKDGRSVASAAEEATGEDELLPAIHRLGNWLRENLGEELVQISFDEEQLEQATTPSLRALELYSRGMQVMRLWRWADAEVLFRQAVTEDPEFASANLFVFWALYNQGKGFEEEAQSFLERAMELAGSTSEQERYFIEGTYYDLFEGDHEKACESNKILAELFPDHYWAAGNATGACCDKLGHREACVRYPAQGAKQRVELLHEAAMAFTFLAGDFDRARPDVAQLRGLVAEGGIPAWKTGVASGAAIFTEFFSAEEFLDKGLLPDVVSELQRVELALGSMGASARSPLVIKLVNFYLALGQFQKARVLAHEVEFTNMFPAWFAFLAGDQAVFQGHIEDFLADFTEEAPDPTERLLFLLSINLRYVRPPLDVLVPLYDPDTAVAMASPAGEPAPEFLSWPKFQAKLQLARGKQMLNQGRLDEAIVLLKSGVRWFRDYGDWTVFQMYFMGAEFLAVAYAEQGNLQAAYRVLEDAAGQRNLVNSFSAPLHQKIQARRALLARELGRTAEAESIEAELAEALRFADEDHPILIQIREQQRVFLEIE
jgi:tetratricopeptide (TPR) repeat protein